MERMDRRRETSISFAMYGKPVSQLSKEQRREYNKIMKARWRAGEKSIYVPMTEEEKVDRRKLYIQRDNFKRRKR